MQKSLIGILILLTIVVIFAVQNANVVYVTLWLWQLRMSLALLISLAVTSGAVLSYLFSIPGRNKKKKKIENMENKISLLEEEKDFHKNMKDVG
jgi:uncharacterized integral membrane protein